MALLHALPVLARVDQRVVRLGADGGGVEEDFRTQQRHAACAFGEPLVPADAHADFRVAGLPDPEAGVAGIEVVLLVVTGAVGNMALAIDAQIAAVGVDDRNAVEARAAAVFEEADRQHHLQLGGKLLEMRDRRVLVGRRGEQQIVGVGFLAEVRGFEQFLDQDDLRALRSRLAHQVFGLGDIRRAIPGTGHLGGGDGDETGHGGPRGVLRDESECGPAGRGRIYSRYGWGSKNPPAHGIRSGLRDGRRYADAGRHPTAHAAHSAWPGMAAGTDRGRR